MLRVGLFGYVYNDGELIPDGIQSPIVKQIFSDYLGGLSITKLVDNLNIEGHIGINNSCSYRTVMQVLDNAIYCGLTNFNGETYKGTHEHIIAPDTREQVQMELEKRQRQAYAKNNNQRQFQAKYLLSGLLRCGCCTANMELIQRSKKNEPHNLQNKSSASSCCTSLVMYRLIFMKTRINK